MIETLSSNIELAIAILGFLGAAIGFFKYQYLRRPRLEIKYKRTGGRRRIGDPTNYPHDSGKIPNAADLNHIYHYEVQFELEILNNSEIDAYDIKLEILDRIKGNFRFFHPLEFSPLSSHGTYLIQGKFLKDIESKFRQAPEIPSVSKEFEKDLKIIIEAFNKYRIKKFYTFYSDGDNHFKIFRP